MSSREVLLLLLPRLRRRRTGEVLCGETQGFSLTIEIMWESFTVTLFDGEQKEEDLCFRPTLVLETNRNIRVPVA